MTAPASASGVPQLGPSLLPCQPPKDGMTWPLALWMDRIVLWSTPPVSGRMPSHAGLQPPPERTKAIVYARMPVADITEVALGGLPQPWYRYGAAVAGAAGGGGGGGGGANRGGAPPHLVARHPDVVGRGVPGQADAARGDTGDPKSGGHAGRRGVRATATAATARAAVDPAVVRAAGAACDPAEGDRAARSHRAVVLPVLRRVVAAAAGDDRVPEGTDRGAGGQVEGHRPTRDGSATGDTDLVLTGVAGIPGGDLPEGGAGGGGERRLGDQHRRTEDDRRPSHREEGTQSHHGFLPSSPISAATCRHRQV